MTRVLARKSAGRAMQGHEGSERTHDRTSTAQNPTDAIRAVAGETSLIEIVGTEPPLRSRGPAFAVMRQCLALQAEATPVGRTARFFGRSPLHPDARSRYRGALGEIVVAGVLSQLGPEWHVLHAVPVGAGTSDIDHVVIGPPGIFTINTRNHSGQKVWVSGGKFLVNGVRHEHIRSSLHKGVEAQKRLSNATGRPTSVTPLIIVVNPRSLTIGRRIPKATVLSSDQLRRWLQRRPRVLSERAIAHYAMFAEEQSTWLPLASEDLPAAVPPAAQPALPQGDLLDRFEALRLEVDGARRRAQLWLVAACAAIAVGLPFAAYVAFDLVTGAIAQ